jgi:hypothetical protein
MDSPSNIASPSLKPRGIQSPALRVKKVESPLLRGSPSLKTRARLESGGSSNSTPLVQRRRTPSNCSTPKVGRRGEMPSSNQSTPARRAPADLPLPTKQGPKSKYSESELKLIEADKEADRKYRQLIREAESLLVHIRNVAVEEVDLETPTVEEPIITFPPPPTQPPPPQTRPDPARLQIKVRK